MPTTDPRQMLQELRAGPYAGRGGFRALAADLDVAGATLEKWQRAERNPSYDNRLRIRRLWQSHGLHETPPENHPPSEDPPASP